MSDLIGTPVSNLPFTTFTISTKEPAMTFQGQSEKSAPVKQENVSANLEEDIRHRAYELYVQRGRKDGHDLDDWLRAEKEIKWTRIRRAAA
jgi:hypothetical protein